MPPGARVRLERPAAARMDEFLAAVGRSRVLHADYVAPPETPQAYRRFVRQDRLTSEARFFGVTIEESALAGVVTLGAIVRDSERSASLGYYAFEPHAGCGLMREAVALAIARAFENLGLERLDASIRPDNDRSRRLAERLGFRCDGLALHEVRIAGRWFAHERWVLHAEEWARAIRAGRFGPRRAARSAAESVAVNCRSRTR